MNQITVKTASREYQVTVGRGILRSIGEMMRELVPANAKVFVISSTAILELWGAQVTAAFSEAGREALVLTMPDGEASKRFATVETLAAKMITAGADRRSVVLALGGGVVGDVAGFLASIFMRGIPVVQIPTTLVAQIDSAIGGKTGVNLVSGKNLIGTFHQPLAVLADPDVLRTLPEREYRSGLLEAMKYGVIRDPEIFHLMESQRENFQRKDPELLERLVVACVRVKADVVSADERESGERRILNFGHTIGHALEAATNYKHFLHGEAVGWGMIAAAIIGREMGITNAALAEQITALVQGYGVLPKVEVSGKKVLKLLQSDKKTVGGVPHFVLASSMGKVEIINTVSSGVVLQAVQEIQKLSRA